MLDPIGLEEYIGATCSSYCCSISATALQDISLLSNSTNKCWISDSPVGRELLYVRLRKTLGFHLPQSLRQTQQSLVVLSLVHIVGRQLGVQGGVGEHRQDVEQEPGVGLGQLGTRRQLDSTGAGSEKTRGGTRGTSAPPSSSSHSPASVVGAAVVLVARPLSGQVGTALRLLLVVLVVLVIAVMVNVPLVCLYVKVRGRMMMMVRWLDGRMVMVMMVVVEGRLVQLVCRGREEAGPGLCQNASLVVPGVEVDCGVSHPGRGGSVEVAGRQ